MRAPVLQTSFVLSRFVPSRSSVRIKIHSGAEPTFRHAEREAACRMARAIRLYYLNLVPRR